MDWLSVALGTLLCLWIVFLGWTQDNLARRRTQIVSSAADLSVTIAIATFYLASVLT